MYISLPNSWTGLVSFADAWSALWFLSMYITWQRLGLSPSQMPGLHLIWVLRGSVCTVGQDAKII